MSDHTPFGFGKFIPGFDFLQNLGKAGQSAPGMPPMSHWVAPTVSVEEISKRIEELKAVQFWLEQNSRALTATIQALEVQKMTLNTLQGMNVSMADLAKAFAGQAAAASASSAAAAAASTQATSGLADWPMSSAAARKPKAEPAGEAPSAAPTSPAQPAAPEPASDSDTTQKKAAGTADSAQASGMGDPMLWWGALTQQFQQIAAQALQDPAQQEAMAKATHMATDFTKAAMHAASTMVRQASEGVQAASAAATGVGQKTASASKATSRATAGSAPPAAAKPAARKPTKTPAGSKAATGKGTKAAAPKAAPARKRSV